MVAKSERLRKLENEREDLSRWLELGLVPKSDLKRHKEEIRDLERKIEEELERLEQLRQSGQVEEFITPKRQSKGGYNDAPTASGLDLGESGFDDDAFGLETESSLDHTTTAAMDTEHTSATGDETRATQEWEEDPFKEKNRWKRRQIIDPDADEW